MTAIQYNGTNAFEVWAFVGRQDLICCVELQTTDRPTIETLGGPVRTEPGDWIMRVGPNDVRVAREVKSHV